MNFYPEETEEKKQLRELNLRLEKMEAEKQREVLKNKALNIASEKSFLLIKSLIWFWVMMKKPLWPISVYWKKYSLPQFSLR
jgi:hypothetical protein